MGRPTRLGSTGLIAALALAVLIGGSGPVEAKTNLLFNFYLPRSTPFWVALVAPWMKAVEEKTHGQVEITVPTAPMAGAKNAYELVQKGAADLSVTANSFQVNQLKLLQITNIPFMAPTAESASVALWRTYQKYFKAAHEFRGTIPLSLWAIDDNVVQSVHSPIVKISEMVGKKMLTSPAQIALAKAMGGTPVNAPIGQYFEMLSGGIADGTINVVGAAFHMKFGHYIHAITLFPGGLGRVAFMLVINEKTWKKLPEADRKVMARLAGVHAARRVGMAFDEEDAKTEPTLRKWGVHFYHADTAFIDAAKKRLGFMERNWLADAKERHINGPAALAYYKKVVAEVAVSAKK